MADQAARVAFAHGSAFTTEPLEAYAAEVGPHLPVDDPDHLPGVGRLGGDRDRAQARPGLPPRGRRARPGSLFSHAGAATTATRSARSTCPGARRSAGRTSAWLGRFRHVVRGVSVRGGTTRRPGPRAIAEALADELERAIVEAGAGPGRGVRGRAVVGATLGAAVPPDGYWPRIAEVCRRHGVLLIADEVMTGFGRTGRWFGSDHWGLRPDILVAAKGATSGYWPFGFVAASGSIHAAVTGAAGFVHGFTYSHSPVGAAVAREVLRILEPRVAGGGQRGQGRTAPGPADGRPRRAPGGRRDPRAWA